MSVFAHSVTPLRVAICVLAVQIYALEHGRGHAQKASPPDEKHVYCCLEALSLRDGPTDGAAASGVIAKLNERMTALKRHGHWVLVRKSVGNEGSQGWVKAWHISPERTEPNKALPDLRRMWFGKAPDGTRGIEVEGDVAYEIHFLPATRDGKEVLRGEVNVTLFEYQHYFFDIHADESPLFTLSPGRTFTPEHMAIYEIRDGKPNRVGTVEPYTRLLDCLPDAADIHLDGRLGVAFVYSQNLLRIGEQYGLLWLEQTELKEWAQEAGQEPRTASLGILPFATKVVIVAQVSRYAKVVVSASGKVGWLESALIGRPERIEFLRSKRIVGRSLTVALRDRRTGECVYKPVAGTSHDAASRWLPAPGACVLFDGEDVAEALRKGGRIPDSLGEPKPGTVYLFTEGGEFVALP